MKVLYLSHRTPYPPDRGDRIRSFHLLRHLVDSHDVWLACVDDTAPTSVQEQTLRAICKDVAVAPLSKLARSARAATSILCGKSATEGYFLHPALADVVTKWHRKHRFDAIVCYCSSMFQYTQLPELAHVPAVVDLVDVDSQKWRECASIARFPRRILHQWEAARVGKLEDEITKKAAAVTVISADEAAHLAERSGSGVASVIPNGVDLEYFSAIPGAVAEPRTCCFVGVLNYLPNVQALEWFLSSVWPVVRSKVDGARLLVVGKSPNPSVRRIASAPGVELHADVPDVRPFIARSTVSIAPMQIARGVQNKVLEAMAMGKAVIASPAALQGIDAQPECVLSAYRPNDWQEILVRCFHQEIDTEQLGHHARAYVEQHHDWIRCLAPLSAVLRSITAKPVEDEAGSDGLPVAPTQLTARGRAAVSECTA